MEPALLGGASRGRSPPGRSWGDGARAKLRLGVGFGVPSADSPGRGAAGWAQGKGHSPGEPVPGSPPGQGTGVQNRGERSGCPFHPGGSAGAAPRVARGGGPWASLGSQPRGRGPGNGTGGGSRDPPAGRGGPGPEGFGARPREPHGGWAPGEPQGRGPALCGRPRAAQVLTGPGAPAGRRPAPLGRPVARRQAAAPQPPRRAGPGRRVSHPQSSWRRRPHCPHPRWRRRLRGASRGRRGGEAGGAMLRAGGRRARPREVCGPRRLVLRCGGRCRRCRHFLRSVPDAAGRAAGASFPGGRDSGGLVPSTAACLPQKLPLRLALSPQQPLCV